VNFTGRKRHGLVPDFLVRWAHKEQLLELKTFHHCVQYFPHTDLTSDKRYTGADRWTSKIHKEYLDKARAVDKNYNNHTTDGPGPLYTRLSQFGRVQGLAIGPMERMPPPTSTRSFRRSAQSGRKQGSAGSTTSVLAAIGTSTICSFSSTNCIIITPT